MVGKAGTFREIVESDLRSAARLVIKVEDQLDPQWRIATPTGDWVIAAMLPTDDQGHRPLLRALSTFMVLKEALAFTLASELSSPDCVFCCGVRPSDKVACMALIARQPRP